MIKAQDVKKLREITGAGIVECKKALENSFGDFNEAIKYLQKNSVKIAGKKSGRNISEGYVGSYIHSNGKIGVLIEVDCETDFVARSEEFRALVSDLAMHIAASNPEYIDFNDIKTEIINEKKRELLFEMQGEKKHKELIEKIAEGKLKKQFEQICLLSQPFVKDSEKTIGELIIGKIAKFGENVKVKRFARFEIE